MDLDHRIDIRLSKEEKNFFYESAKLSKMDLTKLIKLAVPFYCSSQEFIKLRKDLEESAHSIYLKNKMNLFKSNINLDKDINNFLFEFKKALLRQMEKDPGKINKIIIGGIRVSLGHKDLEEGIYRTVKLLCPHRLKFCVKKFKEEQKKLPKPIKKIPKFKRKPATVLGDITRKYQEKKKSE